MKGKNVTMGIKLLRDGHHDYRITLCSGSSVTKKKEWFETNRKAFDDYNRMVHEYGLYSDDRRLF